MPLFHKFFRNFNGLRKIPSLPPSLGRFRRSHLVAGGIFALIALWLLSGVVSGPAGSARLDLSSDRQLTRVRTQVLQMEALVTEVVLRGRTEASRRVQVRAQTPGTVVAMPADKGVRVETGDLLCALSLDARMARLEEADALMRQRSLEYDVARKLESQGHRSRTQMAEAEAARDAASAMKALVEIDIAHTQISAPFTGRVETRHLEIGDYAEIGDPCVTIVDINPILVVAQASEREVASLSEGAAGYALLTGGLRVDGDILFVAASADINTRTFLVELEAANPFAVVRDGISAELHIPLPPRDALRVPQAALTLNSAGEIGIRTVDEDSIVHFVPVALLADGPGGVWVSGPEPGAMLITVGQEFVSDGERVEAVMEEDDSGSES